MEITNKIEQKYENIKNKLHNMIPEKWDKLVLYVSVFENVSRMKTGEMYFYYFPKGIIKRPPVNLYEIVSKFNLDEVSYEHVIEDLYMEFEFLRDEFIKNKQEVWTNLTMCIEKDKIDVFYDYENLLESKYSEDERHIIWEYKYLNSNLETYGKKERQIIQNYLNTQ